MRKWSDRESNEEKERKSVSERSEKTGWQSEREREK